MTSLGINPIKNILVLIKKFAVDNRGHCLLCSDLHFLCFEISLKVWSSHRYLIEVDCSLGQFKSAKLKDKEYTINAPFFVHNIAKKEMDAQIFNICWQMVSC